MTSLNSCTAGCVDMGAKMQIMAKPEALKNSLEERGYSIQPWRGVGAPSLGRHGEQEVIGANAVPSLSQCL